MASSLSPELCEKLIAEVRPYTMAPSLRLAAVVIALERVVRENVPGDVVECGVWRGGVPMLAAKVLQALGDTTRRIWLYDTFKGMTEPADIDRRPTGESAWATWAARQHGESNDWCFASLDDVKTNLRKTGYPEDQFTCVEGDVQETLQREKPEQISLLRLDTDWYASTRAELDTLFPLLAPRGYLLVDDYSDWEGSRQAVRDYFDLHADIVVATTIVEGSLVGRRS